MRKYHTKYLLAFLIVLVMGGGITFVAHAADTNVNFNVDFPRVPAPVPGKFFDLNCIEGLNTDLCSSEFQYAPSIGNIVLLIFSAAVWIAGLIAFGVLLYAGFLYIFAGSSPGNKGKAKEMFVNVAWGLGILLLSVVTLNLINPDIANLKTTGLESVDIGTTEPSPIQSVPPMPEPINTSGKFGCAWDPNGSPNVCIDGIKEYPPYPACKTSFMACTGGLPYILCEGITNPQLCTEFKEVYCDLGESGGPFDLEHPPNVAQIAGEFAACLGSCLNQYLGNSAAITECTNECWATTTGGGTGSETENCKENCLATVPPGLEFECDGLPACSGGEAADGYYRLPASNFYTRGFEDASCGKLELVQMLQDVAKKWSEMGGAIINVRDLNGGGEYNSRICHATHNRGVDVDININGVTYNKEDPQSAEWLIKLGKLLVDTGVVSGFIHRVTTDDEKAALEVVNSYFESRFPDRNPWNPSFGSNTGFWKTDTPGNHERHIHIHIGDSDGATGTGIQPGPYNRSCSVDTPWRYYPLEDACCTRTTGIQRCENG